MANDYTFQNYLLDFPTEAPTTDDEAIRVTLWVQLSARLKKAVNKILRSRDTATEQIQLTAGSKTVLRKCLERIRSAWDETQRVLEIAKTHLEGVDLARIDNLYEDIETEVESAEDSIEENLEARQFEITDLPSPKTCTNRMTMSTPAPNTVKAEPPPEQQRLQVPPAPPAAADGPPPAQNQDDQPGPDLNFGDNNDRDADQRGAAGRGRGRYNRLNYTQDDDDDDDTWSNVSGNESAMVKAVAEAFGGMGRSIEKLVSNSELPTEPGFIFDGSSWRYTRFIKDFDEKVGNRPFSQTKKMNQLVLATSGKAREAVEPYQGMEDGYASARQVLKERFGQPYQIVKACIDRLTSQSRLKGNDPEGLRKFADRLSADFKLLNEMELLHEADTQATLRAIFGQLPPGIQSRWIEKVNKIENEGRYPRLKDMVDFVEVQVKKVNHPVFQVTNTERQQHFRPRQQPFTPSRRPEQQRSSTFSTQQHQNHRHSDSGRPPQNQQSQPHSSSSSSSASSGARSAASSSSAPSGRGRPLRTDQQRNSGHSSTPRHQTAPSRHAPTDACEYCQRAHKTVECPVLELQNADVRRQFAFDKRLCFACAGHHMIKNCERRDRPCPVRGCGGRHHRLFCQHTLTTERPVDEHNPAPDADNRETRQTTASIQKRNACDTPKVLLRVVPVQVKAQNGNSMTTFALLDGGSTTTLMSSALADKLGSDGVSREVYFDTVLGSEQSVNVKMADFDISALPDRREDDAPIQLKGVEIVQQLHIDSRYIQDKIDLSKWEHLKDLQTDVHVDLPAVSLCIGQDNPRTQEISDTCYGNDMANEPYAVKTPFGWTVAGPTHRQPNPVVAYVAKFDQIVGQTVECCPEDTPEIKQLLHEIDVAVSRFWNEERHGFSSGGEKTMSQEDKQAVAILQKTIVLLAGHYSVGMLWRDLCSSFPNNYDVAYRCLQHLMKKFEANPEFERMYREMMNKYIKSGYARKLTPEEAEKTTPRTLYLPHSGVENPNKPGKVRVVKNAASEKNGISLNKSLLHGPDLNSTMMGVTLRFRQATVAINADIADMFMRVLVPEDDSDSLRFLWYDDDQSKDGPPSIYKMTRHIFGATDSPCVCVFALQQCARDNAEDYDVETVTTVLKNFYVDDLLKACQSVDGAIRLATQLIEMLQKGGFELMKFVSNRPEVLAALPVDRVAPNCRELLVDFDSLPVQRALGIKWDVVNDTFGVKVTLLDRPNTRRGALSFLCALTDPIGFLAPVTLVGKLVLQEACRRKIEWDETLSPDLLSRWEKWKASLLCLNEFAIPRCFAGLEDPVLVQSIELHHFCDASEVGYGTASYLRVKTSDGKIHTSFVLGKSRTAPLRYIGMPRAEFQSATVAARVDKLVRHELELKIDRVYFWTDSMVALKYIQNTTRRFKSFIAHRKEEILDTSQPDQWNHCPTKMNPADLCSRGVLAHKLLGNELWMKGPPFLSLTEDAWPSTPHIDNNIDDDDQEVKVKNLFASVMEIDDSIRDFLNRFSDWDTLVRATAWLRKFVKYYIEARKKGTIVSRKFVILDLRSAAEAIVRTAQWDVYPDEMQKLTNGMPVNLNSPLSSLRPVMMNHAMRVGGRLAEAPLSFESRHPLIVPKSHHIAELIVRYYHIIVAHTGTYHTLAKIRELYWIPHAKSLIKQICEDCLVCKKIHSRKMIQIIANLPICRLTPYDPPFTQTGIDCFGPMMIKRARSEIKRYGMIATCLSSRAIHLEVLDSMDTDSFINGLRRFIGRRGDPKSIYCDNGSNLVGGSREIRKSVDEWNQAQIERFLQKHHTDWHFQPPTASHMCGVWERLIKSVKIALKAILGNALVSEDVLRTLFVEVEVTLNSRPITASSDDVEDYEALTPNHLLLQRRVDNLPPGLFTDSDMYRRQWRIVQYLCNKFWKRWIRDYLPGLQVLSKWRRPIRDACVGDLVLLTDDNVSRGRWPLARIVSVTPGRDGHVRSVEVKTATSTYRRPIHRLCLLEGASLDKSSASSVTTASSAGAV